MELLAPVCLGAALTMDAFAVSVTEGIQVQTRRHCHALKVAFLFGLFQAAMPMLGYYAGCGIYQHIRDVDHWVAAGLLCFLGGRMIAGSHGAGTSASVASAGSMRALLLLALATSIDALAAGITLAVQQEDILRSAGIIGAITFVCCYTGVLIGHKLGSLFQKRAELIGGLVLIVLGLKVLWEHLY